MGPIQLPFQGKIDPDPHGPTPGGIQMLQITDTGNSQETDMLVAIVFARTTGTGTVTVQATDPNGNLVELSADLSKGESAKSIIVPVRFDSDPSKNGVWLQSASADARGSILIATI